MYTDKTLKPIYEGQPYTSEDGTQYPGNYPKSEIPGLSPVTKTEQPTDGVVTGFTINEDLVQVWETREKTEEELKPVVKQLTLEQRVTALEIAIMGVK